MPFYVLGINLFAQNDSLDDFHDDRSLQEFKKKTELAKSSVKENQLSKTGSIEGSINDSKRKRQSSSERKSRILKQLNTFLSNYFFIIRKYKFILRLRFYHCIYFLLLQKVKLT